MPEPGLESEEAQSWVGVHFPQSEFRDLCEMLFILIFKHSNERQSRGNGLLEGAPARTSVSGPALTHTFKMVL